MKPLSKLLFVISALVVAQARGAFWYIGSEGVDIVARFQIESHISDIWNPHQVTAEQIGGVSASVVTNAAMSVVATAASTGTYYRALGIVGGGVWQNPANAVDWTWTSNGREITLTGYSGPNAVVIPDMLDGLPVTGFGGIFTDNRDITSVGGGANIKAVGDFAFEGCLGLSSVSLPACTTVGADAFSECENLSSVSLPTCTTVDGYAFTFCEALNSVPLPICTTVGDYAFYGCGNLSSVSLPACTTVGDYAFRECWALNSVTFGQNAPAQAEDVFEYSTPTIYVSNPHATGWGDTWNGRPVVRAASMADISTHNTDGTAHPDIRALISTAGGTTNYVGNLIETAWQNPANATNWTWTKTATEVTLTGYTGPNAVVIPDMLDGLPVTGFGEVFNGNMDITSVGGGANIKAVGDEAFYGCGALSSVSLPACTTVGNSAFETCLALNAVSLPACTTVGNSAFYGCLALNAVSLPACTTVGNSAFYGCGALNAVSLPACITVGTDAFATCWALDYVSLPACTTVGDFAFYGCGNLSSVTFGQNAPAQAANVFEYSTPTIYVSNPHATGWGDTWNGRPVVRLGLYADAFMAGGTNVMGRIDSHASTLASPTTLGHVKVGDGLDIDGGGVLSAQPNFGLVWDSGSNRFWKVTATNLRFFVWGDL